MPTASSICCSRRAATTRRGRAPSSAAALVDYARAQHGLTIPKGAFPTDWGLKPASYDADATLAQALQGGTLKAWLDEQAPATPAYQALQKAYLSYLKIQAAGGWPMVSATTAPAELRLRLAFEDPQLATLAPNAPADGGVSRGAPALPGGQRPAGRAADSTQPRSNS